MVESGLSDFLYLTSGRSVMAKAIKRPIIQSDSEDSDFDTQDQVVEPHTNRASLGCSEPSVPCCEMKCMRSLPPSPIKPQSFHISSFNAH